MSEREWPIRPYDAPTCRERLRYLREYYQEHGIPDVMTKGMQGALIGAMNTVFGSEDKDHGDGIRHQVLGWLFGDSDVLLKPKSTKEFTAIEWYVVYKWVNLQRVEEPYQNKVHWLPCNEFITEALHVKFAALDAFRKQETHFMQQLGFDEVENG